MVGESMTIDLLMSPFEFIVQQLMTYILPNASMIGALFLIIALMISLASGLEFGTSLFFLSPLIIGLIGQAFIPNLFWVVLILLSTILWTMVAFKIANVSRGD